MSTDRELLELAARAAGIPTTYMNYDGVWINPECTWNPLADDGDALRLSVKLGLTLRLNQFDEWTQVFIGNCYPRGAEEVSERIGSSRGVETIEQATRRAIVRAAAEIGRNMP